MHQAPTVLRRNIALQKTWHYTGCS